MAKCPHCKSTNISPVQVVKLIGGRLMQTGSAKACNDCDASFAHRDVKKPLEA